MNNIGEDVEINIENLKCCGNCKEVFIYPCKHEIGGTIWTEKKQANSFCDFWKFDNRNYIDRILKEE